MEKDSRVRNDIMFNYENLVIAVIEKAANDYRTAKKRLARQDNKLKKLNLGSKKYEDTLKEIRSIRHEIISLEHFFKTSEWIGLVENMDGEYLLENLKKEFKSA